MTALDVIRDIAEYSRPDALSRIRADAYRHPHDPANSGAYDDVVDEVKERILADSTEVGEHEHFERNPKLGSTATRGKGTR